MADNNSQYSTTVGAMYVFNLIVGTGALTMPAAFQSSGWVIGLVIVVILAFFSFVTVTFMTESMAVANALVCIRDAESDKEEEPGIEHGGNNSDSISQHSLLLPRNDGDIFEIVQRIEMGEMAKMFFNNAGVLLFYICISVYLYGDLSIYAVVVPKSMRDVICTYDANSSIIPNGIITDNDRCWTGVSLTRWHVYQILVVVFVLIFGPFAFFDVQKTKYMQVTTTLARWTAFSLMLVLVSIQLARGRGDGQPPMADLSGTPNLFGVCIYAFMCHHSLPSLVTPIRNKSHLTSALAGTYLLILAFYSALSISAVFTFAQVDDIYTLNFQPHDDVGGQLPVTQVKLFQYFLALFPVFTLSTTFPLIAITLRNNLQALSTGLGLRFAANRYSTALLAVLPPTVVASVTSQVELLVSITGSYAGAGVQYLIPACLVLLARRRAPELERRGGGGTLARHRSPFRHNGWVYAVVVWAAVCVALVTVNHALTGR